jgi:hypothetical protein
VGQQSIAAGQKLFKFAHGLLGGCWGLGHMVKTV